MSSSSSGSSSSSSSSGPTYVGTYRWVWITSFNDEKGNSDNTLSQGDYATSNKNAAGRRHNHPTKKMYYPSGAYVHEFGSRAQIGSIQDTGDGGNRWKYPGGTLSYASWLDRWTSDPKENATLSYWAAVLIIWKSTDWQLKDGGLPDAREFRSIAEAESAIAQGEWLPIGPDGKESATRPPKDCYQ